MKIEHKAILHIATEIFKPLFVFGIVFLIIKQFVADNGFCYLFSMIAFCTLFLIVFEIRISYYNYLTNYLINNRK